MLDQSKISELVPCMENSLNVEIGTTFHIWIAVFTCNKKRGNIILRQHQTLFLFIIHSIQLMRAGNEKAGTAQRKEEKLCSVLSSAPLWICLCTIVNVLVHLLYINIGLESSYLHYDNKYFRCAALKSTDIKCLIIIVHLG